MIYKEAGGGREPYRPGIRKRGENNADPYKEKGTGIPYK